MSKRASKAAQVHKIVMTRQEAAEVISSLLRRFGTGSTKEHLNAEARRAKQTEREVARRAASNLLRSFSLYK